MNEAEYRPGGQVPVPKLSAVGGEIFVPSGLAGDDGLAERILDEVINEERQAT